MNWIRIATKMKGDPRIGAVASACKVRIEHAVGLVACTLMEFPDHARNGDIGAVPDVVLEQWALWSGKSGVFAAAFRTHLCDETGAVRSWEKHNGKAMRKAESDIERKRLAREQRESGAKTARAEPAPSARQNAARRQNGQVDEDETRRKRTTTSSADAADAVVLPDPASSSAPDREALLAQFADATHRNAVAGYLRSAQYPGDVAAYLAKAIHPEGGGHRPADVGQALHEMRLKNVNAFGSRVFEGFLRTVKAEANAAGSDPSGPVDFERIDAVSLAKQGSAESQQLCDERGWAWRDVA